MRCVQVSEREVVLMQGSNSSLAGEDGSSLLRLLIEVIRVEDLVSKQSASIKPFRGRNILAKDTRGIHRIAFIPIYEPSHDGT